MENTNKIDMPIGSIFRFRKNDYKVVFESTAITNCFNCAFLGNHELCELLPVYCYNRERKDGKSVYFEKIEEKSPYHEEIINFCNKKFTYVNTSESNKDLIYRYKIDLFHELAFIEIEVIKNEKCIKIKGWYKRDKEFRVYSISKIEMLENWKKNLTSYIKSYLYDLTDIALNMVE